jgi:uncharacterized protein
VLRTSFDDGLDSSVLQRLQSDITAGIEACRTTCEYFRFCGGGSPGNKIGENGTANSTTTAFCRFQYQQLIESVMTSLDGRAAATASRPSA